MAKKLVEETTEETVDVTVARIGGEIKEVTLNGDRSIGAALTAYGLDWDSSTRVRIDGEEVSATDENYELEDGDRVTVLTKVKGATV